MKRRIFVADAGEAMPTISFEQPCRKRFQTEAERERHSQLMRRAEERRRAVMLVERDLNKTGHKDRKAIPSVKVILSQIRGR